MSTNRTACQSGYDPLANCAQCLTGRDDMWPQAAPLVYLAMIPQPTVQHKPHQLATDTLSCKYTVTPTTIHTVIITLCIFMSS